MALSVKTREHIRRWAALAGPKWGALLGGAAALAAAITFTGSALHFTTVADTHGDTVRILTAATDLAAVLQQSGTPPLGEHDEAVCSPCWPLWAICCWPPKPGCLPCSARRGLCWS